MPPSSLRPLRHRSFALLFAGSAVSNIGTWMETVAVGALVYQATGRAAWVSAVAAATFLPFGLLGPVGGALADRIDRRRFMMAANGFEACVAAALAVLAGAGRAHPGTVVALVFLEGCSSGLRVPFQQSVIPDLVPRDDLLAASALGAAQYNAGRVVGPAVAGAVIGLWSFAGAFAVNAFSFLAVIGALAAVPIPRVVPDPGEADAGIVRRIRAGIGVAWAEPGCRAAIVFIGVAALLVSPFIALVPVKAGLLVGRSGRAVARATAVLTTVQGVGAIVGALSLGALADRFGTRAVTVGGLVSTPVLVALYAAAPTLPLAAALLALVGACYIGILSGLGTVVQLRAPTHARGRVLGVYTMALALMYPLGALVQGSLADRVGFAWCMGGAAVLLLAVVGGVAVARPGTLAALDARGYVAPVTPAPT